MIWYDCNDPVPWENWAGQGAEYWSQLCMSNGNRCTAWSVASFYDVWASILYVFPVKLCLCLARKRYMALIKDMMLYVYSLESIPVYYWPWSTGDNTFGPSICLSICICGTYIVHHFNGTELCCAPSRSALCIIDLCCTTQVAGAQHSPVPLKWFTTKAPQTQMDKWTDVTKLTFYLPDSAADN